MLSYVSATPDALYSQPLRKKYFGILANTGSRQNYDTAMRDWVAQTTDVPALLDYASIGQASGFKEAAANGYARVLALDPNNAKALSRTAALDFGKGKYSSAEKNLNQYMAVQQQAPDAEGDVVQAHFYKAELLRRQGNVEFGFTAQNDGIDTNNTRRARDGRIDDYSADRQRGELYAAYKFDNGVRTQASLFANNDRLGGGAFVTFNNPLGRTELIGEYQRPYWDFVEAVYEDTTRDRVGFKHYARPRASTGLGLELSYNNYSISERDDVAQSVLFRANVVQDIQKQTESQPYLGVGYGFDGEYITGGKPDGRLDGFNNFYYLLPIRTREIHALTGIYRNDWTPSTHALVVAGVAYSRFTENFTPLAEIRVDQDITDNWQIGGRARYAQETNDTSNNQLNLGADILYKF